MRGQRLFIGQGGSGSFRREIVSSAKRLWKEAHIRLKVFESGLAHFQKTHPPSTPHSREEVLSIQKQECTGRACVADHKGIQLGSSPNVRRSELEAQVTPELANLQVIDQAGILKGQNQLVIVL